MRVSELWRYPVKSLRGERLERVELDAGGLRGDRRVRPVRAGKRVSARTVPELLGLAGGLDGDGVALIDGRPWHDPEALAAVRGLAGPEVELIEDETRARFDAAPVLVVTDGALAALGKDRRRFRPNLVLEGVEGLTERDWIGARLRVGEVELRVVSSCERCLVTTIDPDTLRSDPDVLRRINDDFDGMMGVYCEVAELGPIAVGDRAELL